MFLVSEDNLLERKSEARQEIPACRNAAEGNEDKNSRIRGIIGLWYNCNRIEGKKVISEADRLVILLIQ